jgi:TPR repeat protein
MYANGDGVPVDKKEAVKLFQRAAEKGYLAGQFNLGSMYERGEGVRSDIYEAAKGFEKAAKQGDSEAEAAYARISRLIKK